MNQVWHRIVPSLRNFSRSIASSPHKFREVDSLPIPESLRVSLRNLGVSRLTPIQSETFGPIILGQSITAFDRTGSGKTLAYLVPVLARISQERLTKTTSCLIIVPTQELCQQIGGVLVGLDPSINVLLANGKPDAGLSQILRQGGAQIVIGTGGRIASLVKRGDIDLEKIRVVVVDEIDCLLDRDYRKAVSSLLDAMKEERYNIGSKQIIAFGATRTPQLKEILAQYPVLASINDVDLLNSSRMSSITHSLMKVPGTSVERISALACLLCTQAYTKAIVFANTIDEARAIGKHPLLHSRVTIFHGSLDRATKDKLLGIFKEGKISTLICTDVTARGIDVPGLDLVVSLRTPQDPITYVHRAGRTGRMMNQGRSILFFSPDEKSAIDEIERVGKLKFQSLSIPSGRVRSEALVSALIDEAISRGRDASERLKERVSQLVVDDSLLCETIVKRAVNEILALDSGSKSIKNRISILSGEVGYSPILFVDPGRTCIKNRSDVEMALERLGILRVGLVTLSESGFIVDVPSERVAGVSGVTMADGSYVEIVALSKLPRLVKDEVIQGRKSHAVLPWRRQSTNKRLANSRRYT